MKDEETRGCEACGSHEEVLVLPTEEEGDVYAVALCPECAHAKAYAIAYAEKERQKWYGKLFDKLLAIKGGELDFDEYLGKVRRKAYPVKTKTE